MSPSRLCLQLRVLACHVSTFVLPRPSDCHYRRLSASISLCIAFLGAAHFFTCFFLDVFICSSLYSRLNPTISAAHKRHLISLEDLAASHTQSALPCSGPFQQAGRCSFAFALAATGGPLRSLCKRPSAAKAPNRLRGASEGRHRSGNGAAFRRAFQS